MSQSETIGALTKALVKVQKELGGALKDSTNPFFKSKYADLASCFEASRALLTANGLAVAQTTRVEGTANVLATTLMHESGEWLSGEILLVPVKNDPQGIGSAMTYARRYGYSAIIGLTQVDDDGHEATRPEEPKKPVPKKTDEPPFPGPTKPKAIINEAANLGKVDALKKLSSAVNALDYTPEQRSALLKQVFGTSEKSKIEAMTVIEIMRGEEKIASIQKQHPEIPKFDSNENIPF
jgi:ERF superfamily